MKPFLTLLLLAFLLSGCRQSRVLIAASPSPAPGHPEYVGTESCQTCHAEQHKGWETSNHHDAMALPTEKTVLGDFDNSEFEYFGFRSRFFRRGQEYWVATDGPKGVKKEYKVEYTFGVEPLQQYLIRFPDGRLQTLSICWDTQKKRWFHLFPEEKISSQSPLHWTGPQFNWNFMCAECHSTDVQKNYDFKADSYDTTFSEINVSCESCHGPGSQHLKSVDGKPLANSGFPVNLKGRGPWTAQTEDSPAKPAHPEMSSQQVETCALCHSRRSTMVEPYVHGQPLSETHSVALLTEDLYHADGQIDDEDYVYGSFVQSKMYAAGVVCTDCHDPHTLKPKIKGDDLCLQCHLPARYSVKEHTHHDKVSCIDCHMPGKYYMGVDFRRDHSLRIPRPDLSQKIGSPNACTSCHQDKSVSWAAKAFVKWYGEGSPHFGETLHSGRTGDPGGQEKLTALAMDPKMPEIVRATAVGLSLDLELLKTALTDKGVLVRREAVRVLQQAPPEAREQLLLPLADDPSRTVRIEAGRGLVGLAADSQSAQKAVEEYRTSLLFNADRTESRLGLAALQVAQGDPKGAETLYLQAMERDPRSAVAYVNLADFYRSTGMDQKGEAVLRKALATLPKVDTAMVHHALGLLLIRKKDKEQALQHLLQATQLAPLDTQAAFVYAVALADTGKSDAAITELQRILAGRPHDVRLLSALVSFAEAAGRADLAEKYRKVLSSLQTR